MRPDAVTRLADRTLDARLPVARDRFIQTAGAVCAKMAKNGAYGGSGYREHMHKLCAAELHERAIMLREALVSTYDTMNGAPSYAMLRAAKDWVADRSRRCGRSLSGSGNDTET